MFGLGLLIAIVPLGWLVLGWQGRLALGLIAFAVAVAVFYQAAGTRNDIIARAHTVALRETSIRNASFRVATGPGIPVTAVGAAVAAVGAMWGGTVGRSVPRLGLPEKPGGDGPA